MLRITRETDYGVVLLTRLTAAHGQVMNARDLSSETHIPLPTASKILKALARGGLLTSHRGVKGGYSLAREGELPEIAEKKTWSRPVAGVLMTATLSLLLANTLDLEAIAIMGSAGFLITFLAVNAASFRLASVIGGSRIIAAAGVLLCAVALCVLLSQAWRENPVSVGALSGIIVFSVAAEWWLARKRGPVFARSSE